MTMSNEDWTLLSDALPLLNPPGWRNGWGAFGSSIGDPQLLRKWIYERRVRTRADGLRELQAYVPEKFGPPAPPPPEPQGLPDPDAKVTYSTDALRNAITGMPMGRYDWPLREIEEDNVDLDPNLWAAPEFDQLAPWENNEVTIYGREDPRERVVLFGLRVNRPELERAISTTGRASPRQAAPPPTEPEPVAEVDERPIRTQLGGVEWRNECERYRAENDPIPNVDRVIWPFYRDHRFFGGRVTQAMVRAEYGGGKRGPRS